MARQRVDYRLLPSGLLQKHAMAGNLSSRARIPGCAGWVRGLGARTSGPHAPGSEPLRDKMERRNSCQSRAWCFCCRLAAEKPEDMRAGGPRTQDKGDRPVKSGLCKSPHNRSSEQPREDSWVRGLGARTSGPHAPAQSRFKTNWSGETGRHRAPRVTVYELLGGPSTIDEDSTSGNEG